ncbi:MULTISPECIES: hypothetical protein [Nostocales]|uniref:HEAT repeat domain-containing protein n=3 Tax=Nostocales TaxID=1161 RepID=A0A8S9SYH2_9CYAN|nr:hypothetical protein [Tolypothrix bouteillei]KAF3884886.1 HEAT repeat domain-containing protein [Tolypothrix bouteillei VB521301]
MINESNQPKESDAVLGGKAPPPVQGAILGGIEGVKNRLSSPILEARVSALQEAMNYGETGLDLIIGALESKFRKVRRAAVQLLQQRDEPSAKLSLYNYKFWSSFERLNGLPPSHATSFANRKVIEFDPSVGITDTIGTAYALRVHRRQPDMNITDKLQIFLQDSRTNEVEALVVGNWFNGTGEYSSLFIVNALVDACEELTNLKALFIGDIEDSEDMISSIEQSNISLIFVAYPNLEVLKIRGDRYRGPYNGGLEIEPLRHDKLKALIVESGGLRHEVVSQICNLELPALEYLELWLGRDDYGGSSSISDLMPILSGVFPKLKYLGLRNSEYSDDIAFAIVNSPIIKHLIELDLSMGNLGDEGAEALLNCPAVNQLDTLNVSNNCLTRAMLSRLQDLEIETIAIPQKQYTWRYCSVAE